MRYILSLFFLLFFCDAFSARMFNATVTSYGFVSDTLIITNDTVVCKGQSVPLLALPAFGYAWSPKTGLDDSTISNPIATPGVTTKYKLESQKIGTNLVVNSDFSAGNTGFTSQYLYSISGIPEGVYFVGANSFPWHPFLNSNVDHTTGTGNMLLVNGDTTFNVIIWQQNIAIVPNTTYIFSVWLQSIYSGNPAELQFSINGSQIGNIFKASATEGVWQQFFTTWQSGAASSASISVINKDTIKLGNDFALDDILFAEILVEKDSVTIGVANKPILTINADTAVCSGSSLQLLASGANSYAWQANSYLSSTTIANPIATPLKDTSFIVTGYNLPNCFSSDTVVVKILPNPVISIASSGSFCKGDSATLNVVGTPGNYLWQPASSLSNNKIATLCVKAIVS